MPLDQKSRPISFCILLVPLLPPFIQKRGRDQESKPKNVKPRGNVEDIERYKVTQLNSKKFRQVQTPNYPNSQQANTILAQCYMESWSLECVSACAEYVA